MVGSEVDHSATRRCQSGLWLAMVRMHEMVKTNVLILLKLILYIKIDLYIHS